MLGPIRNIYRWLVLRFGNRPQAPHRLPRRRWDAVSIPRCTGDGPSPPNSWKSCHPSTVRRFKAELTCPNVHRLVLRQHRISESGHVQPSVVCAASECGFHEYVRLERWDHGALY
jgi:hypothetical protein